jgi:hypothetical protein
MKRFPVLGFLLLVPAIAMFGVIGCNTDKGKSPSPTAEGTGTPTPSPALKTKAVEITTPLDATVKGIVKFKGTAPKAELDPRINEHKEKDFCLSGPEKYKVKQVWMVGKDNELANVVVSLAPPAGKKYKITDKLKEDSKKTVEIDQPFCNYDPHVVSLWPEVQGLVFLNMATVPHNVKIAGTDKMSSPDINMSPKGGPTDKSPVQFLTGGGEVVIDASCSMHTWMNCKIALFTHPYCATTKADGSFEIANVPIDEELTVYLWHESNPTKVAAQKLKAVKGPNVLNMEYPPK